MLTEVRNLIYVILEFETWLMATPSFPIYTENHDLLLIDKGPRCMIMYVFTLWIIMILILL